MAKLAGFLGALQGLVVPVIALLLASLSQLAGLPSPFNWVAFACVFVLALLLVEPGFRKAREGVRKAIGKQIGFDFLTPYFKQRSVTESRTTLGTVAASAASSEAVAADRASSKTSFDVTYAYLPIHNTHAAATAVAEATVEFRDMLGKSLVGGRRDMRWSRSDSPRRQDDYSDPSAFNRREIPGGSDEPVDLVYHLEPGACYFFNNETARSGRFPDPATRIDEADFRAYVTVKSPNARTLEGVLWLRWRDGALEIERES